jgi:hypothetical protein
MSKESLANKSLKIRKPNLMFPSIEMKMDEIKRCEYSILPNYKNSLVNYTPNIPIRASRNQRESLPLSRCKHRIYAS